MTQEERRLYLINFLMNEFSDYFGLKIPETVKEQKRLLRSLMNIRAPREVPEEFLKIQNEYLRNEIIKKGIIDCNTLSFVRDRISIWQGDITTLSCGAIVNAANSAMLGCFLPCHGCIDNSVHTYAGVQLRAECGEIMRKQREAEPTGRAKITEAYNLPCDYIIHTVGPIVRDALTKQDCALLSSCYRSCILLADEYNVKSIAFCCISTGEFRFPNDTAAEIAVKTVTECLEASCIERVIFNVFKNKDREIYEKLLG